MKKRQPESVGGLYTIGCCPSNFTILFKFDRYVR